MDYEGEKLRIDFNELPNSDFKWLNIVDNEENLKIGKLDLVTFNNTTILYQAYLLLN